MIIIIIGPPGSGKTTQAKMLAQKINLPFISIGQVLREGKVAKTLIGLTASKYVEKGKLVPENIIKALTKLRISNDDCEKGFILDGAPRRIEEALELEDYLARNGKKVDYVIYLSLSEEESIKRLLKRYELPKVEGGTREDDNLDSIKVRLKEFYRRIGIIKLYYQIKNLLHVVDGSDTREEIHKKILALLRL